MLSAFTHIAHWLELDGGGCADFSILEARGHLQILQFRRGGRIYCFNLPILMWRWRACDPCIARVTALPDIVTEHYSFGSVDVMPGTHSADSFTWGASHMQ